MEEEESASEEESEEDSDDEKDWITPSNIKQIQEDVGRCDAPPADVQVGCVTTDFAMQVSEEGARRSTCDLG